MRRVLSRTCFGLVLTRVRLVLIRVDLCRLVSDSCWLVLDSCWLVLDSCWLALDSCWFMLTRVDSCWFVLIRVELYWLVLVLVYWNRIDRNFSIYNHESIWEGKNFTWFLIFDFFFFWNTFHESNIKSLLKMT